jgi:hypothetical protein
MCSSSKQFIVANEALRTKLAVSYTCDANVDLVRTLIPYKAGGVAMCDVLSNNFTGIADPWVTSLCRNITNAHRDDNVALLSWLTSNGKATSGEICTHQGHAHSTGMGCGVMYCDSSKQLMRDKDRMTQELAVSYTCDANVDRVRTLIPYEAGGVALCNVLANNFTGIADPWVASLCSNITSAHNTKMAMMANWLTTRGWATKAGCMMTN